MIMTKKDKNMNISGRSLEEWHQLAEKYFEAETTAEEEKALRCFLISPYCPDKEFDEVKAVMGFFSVGKKIRKKRFVFKPYRWIAAAMIVLVVGSVAWKITDDRKNVCVAYIAGTKCTDSREVMNQMKLSMKNVHSVEADNSVDDQLKDIFGTINDSEQNN